MAAPLRRPRPQRCLRLRSHRTGRATARAYLLGTPAGSFEDPIVADWASVDDFCRPVNLPAMAVDSLARLRAGIRDVPNFPKHGIVCKDITPILVDAQLFRESIDVFLERCRTLLIDKVVGIDARGFLFGSAVAYGPAVGS